MSGSLKLVSSFNETSYPHAINVRIGYNPQISGSDRIFQDNPDYKEYKLSTLPRRKEQEIKYLMERMEITNYFIFRNDTSIRIFFKNIDDHMATIAAFSPNNTYAVDFVRCNQDTSKKAMRKIIKELKNAFNQTEIGSNVKFIMDTDRKMIRARTNNGHDFIQFLKESKELRTSPGFPNPY